MTTKKHAFLRADGSTGALTDPALKILLSSIGSRPFDGLLSFQGSGTGVGLMRASWNRAAAQLIDLGLIEPYVHGGYELTDEGRRVRGELAGTSPTPSES